MLGIISDTHGLLRPEAVEALRGSDLILHAGDVGSPEIYEQLRRLAPVHAVRGNIDTDPWCDNSLPQTEVIEVGGLSLYMLHDLKQLDLNPSAAGFAAVICGHSHSPMNEVRDGVLYFNPASAGPRRFKLPICVGRLHIRSSKITGEIVDLARTPSFNGAHSPRVGLVLGPKSRHAFYATFAADCSSDCHSDSSSFSSAAATFCSR